MVRIYEDMQQARAAGVDVLRSPMMREAGALAAGVDELRRALAGFSNSEMDRGNMGPLFLSTDLLSTMRIMISAGHGRTGRHVPEEIQPDGIPNRYRHAFAPEGTA